MSLSSALDGLQSALDGLERAVEGLGAERGDPDLATREEVQRLNADRAALAAELDRSEERARSLAESNREVARRLVAAMETIRTVLDRS